MAYSLPSLTPADFTIGHTGRAAGMLDRADGLDQYTQRDSAGDVDLEFQRCLSGALLALLLFENIPAGGMESLVQV